MSERVEEEIQEVRERLDALESVAHEPASIPVGNIMARLEALENRTPPTPPESPERGERCARDDCDSWAHPESEDGYCCTHESIQRAATPQPQEAESTMDDIPRRIRRDQWTPAEKAIGEAIDVVENLPADERLTKAVILLAEAKGAVADYVDGIEPQEGGPKEDAGWCVWWCVARLYRWSHGSGISNEEMLKEKESLRGITAKALRWAQERDLQDSRTPEPTRPEGEDNIAIRIGSIADAMADLARGTANSSDASVWRVRERVLRKAARCLRQREGGVGERAYCGMCGGKEGVSVVYSKRRDEKRILCRECLLLGPYDERYLLHNARSCPAEGGKDG